ncbi:hypothetical protein D3C71_2156890 [compost metagenome]
MTSDERGEFDVVQSKNPRGGTTVFREWVRNASYRGLHTMEVKIYDANSNIVFSDVIGVHIR